MPISEKEHKKERLHKQIILKYKELNSLRKTGEYFNLSRQTILNILRQHKVDRKNVGSYKKLDRTKTKHAYKMFKEENKNVTEIAKKLNVCTQTVTKALKDQGLKSLKYRKYEVNEHAFDKLSPIAVYWLGFLYGRGTLKSDYHLEIVYTNPQFKPIIKELKNFLGTKQKEFQINLQQLYIQNRLVIGSAVLVNKLKLLNVHPVSKINYPNRLLKTNKRLNSEFIRGYVDAKGTVTSTKITINSNILFLEAVNKIITKHTNVSGNIIKKSNNVYGNLIYTDNNTDAIIKFLLFSKRGLISKQFINYLERTDKCMIM